MSCLVDAASAVAFESTVGWNWAKCFMKKAALFWPHCSDFSHESRLSTAQVSDGGAEAEQGKQDDGGAEKWPQQGSLQEEGVDDGGDDPMSIRFGGKMQSLNTVKEASVFANEARCVSMRTMSAALKMLETQADEIDSVKEELSKIKRRSLLTTAANDGRAKGLVAEFPALTSPSRIQRAEGEQREVVPLEGGLPSDQVEEAVQATYNPNRPRLFKQFGWTLHDVGS